MFVLNLIITLACRNCVHLYLIEKHHEIINALTEPTQQASM